jgi:SagB-type dehydrogenase family enzyme
MKNHGTIRKSGMLSVVKWCILTAVVICVPADCPAQKRPRGGAVRIVQLPPPRTTGQLTLEEALSKRRSVRQFAPKPLDFTQIGQLAWAGQGITEPQMGLRTAPSAGAIYPIELYLVSPQGLFVYQPKQHSLEQISDEDLRRQLAAAALGQEHAAQAACNIVIAGSVRKVATKYGNKARQFMLLEAGHVAQNIQLQAVSLGLVSVPVGAFDTREVGKVLELTGDLEPLLIVCVGHPVESAAQTGEGTKAAGPKRAALIIPRENFRDEELFDTQRILTAAGIQTVVVSSKIGPIRAELGGIAASEMLIGDLKVDDFDAIIFVDGPGVVEYLENPPVLDIARQAAAKGKVLGAISLAPAILANAGVLKNRKATGFISVRDTLKSGGATYTAMALEKDGSIITASGPFYAVPFAQAIVAACLQGGNEPAATIQKAKP